MLPPLAATELAALTNQGSTISDVKVGVKSWSGLRYGVCIRPCNKKTPRWALIGCRDGRRQVGRMAKVEKCPVRQVLEFALLRPPFAG